MSQPRRFTHLPPDQPPDASAPRLLEYDEADPPDPLRPPPTPPKRRRWVIVAVAISIPVAYLGYRNYMAPAPPSTQVEGGVPPLIPSMMNGTPPREVFEPRDGSQLAGEIGSRLPLVVRATGPDGTALLDALVTFRMIAGEQGALSTDSVRTSPDGLAEAVLDLPDTPGTLVVAAELAESALPGVRFDVSVRPGPPVRVELVAGNRQTAAVGGLLPSPLTVQVSDQIGNPVPNAEVRFQINSGGGLSAPSRTQTDSLGQASARWRLGPAGGQQELVAVLAATGQQMTFTANAQTAEANAPTEQPRPSPAEPVRVVPAPFAVGGSHVCSVVGGTARCRGGNDRGQVSGAEAAGLQAITAGISFTCGLDTLGTAWCWGANESGQLGDGTRSDRPTPVNLAIDMRFSVLSAGASHTCGLVTGGYAACWGQNLSGQLGDGSREDRTAPRVVAGGRSFTSLSAGWNHTCGLSPSGDVLCWGLNSDGQLGDGSRLDRLVPTPVGRPYRLVAAGNAHTCAISGGDVVCWGANRFGQLGDGTTDNRTRPVSVVGLPGPAIGVATGAVHSCALVEGGEAYCWGQNLYGQLGDGSNEHRSTPTAVVGGQAFTRLYAGGAVTCGLSVEPAEYCWGLNQNGQLGDGTRINRSRPTRAGG